VPRRNLDEAHNLYSALLRAIVAHPGGSDDPDAVRHVSSLCARAVEVIDDENAHSILRNIETLAGLLFSAAGHVDAQAGSLRGVAALKFHLFNALSNLRGRLQMVQQARPSMPELPALEAKKNQRILVVEDDHDSALSLKKLLELCGYAVTVAFTCSEGLEAAEKTPPDIVLCDIGLPDCNGYDFATALRSKPGTARTRLIAVTAYGSEEDQKRSRAAGFQLHLVKPVKPEHLLEELDRPRRSANGK
jgi:CheY-like chemotaxis protein